MHFIVKLFPEITIKSAPVRKRFTRQLRTNLKYLLKAIDPEVKVTNEWEKIEVSSPATCRDIIARIADVLSNTPGIAFFSEVVAHEFTDQQDIFEKTKAIWGEALAGKTFAVRVKRFGDHDFASTDVERFVGGGLNQHTNAAGVKLKNPDLTIKLEIKHQKLFVVQEQHPGLGGFPLGTQDPVLSLISGGFDSVVASYLTMRRGVRSHYVFFNLGGHAHEVGVKEVAYFLWHKYSATHKVKFITVPFEGVVSEILQKIDPSLMGVVLKRMMLRAASQLAEQMKFKALVTGESVAQVSSQTLQNLNVIDRITNQLVLRPLAMMDKGDIIDIARKIGAEDFAANMPEYCGVISQRPSTAAKFEKVEATEENFDFSILDNAVNNRRIEWIDEVMDALPDEQPLEEFGFVPIGSQVIDIRHPHEEELNPLPLGNVLKIPFYKLHQTELDFNGETKRYLLYCEQGVMSRLHAGYLLNEQQKSTKGTGVFGVYRP